MTKAQRIRHWLFIVGFNLVAVALLTEIGLRVFAPCLAPPPVYEPHPVYGHFHVPNSSGVNCSLEFTISVDINNHGLRDDADLEYVKPDGVQRVLVIGDSFTEGFGVEAVEAFPAVLETQLNSSSRSVQVINGGVAGYGTAHALKFLADQGVRYQPDLVIYAFYPNDVNDNAQLFELDAGKLNALPVNIPESQALASLLNNNFYTYRALNRALRYVGRQLNVIERPRDLSWPIYRAVLEDNEIQAWALTGALLDEMQAVTTAAGARLLIVYLPEIFQTIDAEWETAVAKTDELMLRDAPNVALREHIPHGADYLDLLPGFRAVSDPLTLYYPLDTHFTPAGHALVAELVAAHIQSNRLLGG